MNRFVLASSTLFLLTAGAAMAQNPLNTTAPGPSQETKPGQTNNDFPNPGHPIPAPNSAKRTPAPVTENGTTEGTASESMQRDQSGASTMGTTATPTDTTVSTDTTTTGVNGTTDTTATSVTTGRLPRTGSELPLVGLIGLTSLAGFALLRARNA
jgi:cobalamin biosynthesis Mg chelatase CobN